MRGTPRARHYASEANAATYAAGAALASDPADQERLRAQARGAGPATGAAKSRRRRRSPTLLGTTAPGASAPQETPGRQTLGAA
jgi:hypothetical protein